MFFRPANATLDTSLLSWGRLAGGAQPCRTSVLPAALPSAARRLVSTANLRFAGLY